MKPFRELISFEEAKKIIMEKTKEMERVETVKLLEARNRVLAEDIVAELNVPGFKRAAVDGYAVIAEDTYGASHIKPKKLKIVGKIFAGEVARGKLNHGEAMEIATGAALPKGSDAVVMVENTEKVGNEIKILKPVYPGANVSKEDEDIKKGEVVLKKGEILNPAKIGVLAALGMESVEVYEKANVIIIPTGDELVKVGEKLEYGKIYDINSYTLTTLLKPYANVKINEITKDSKEEIERILENGKDMDYIIFSGGSSVGEKDILADVLIKKGELFFHGIALKPGKPTIFGRFGNALVFGMPGYPTSCLTNAYVLLLPSIKKRCRINEKEIVKEAILEEKIVSTIGRHQIYPVMLKNGRAYPVFKESGAITSMSRANGYIEIPANVEYVEKGSTVKVHLL
ncbi:MAG: molybdenum cofactor biosynthesis protein [Thermoplasmata archaeon]|nr:molybdenum cofactor biosynthesis protein [Thermoplasmata archaeon]